MERQPKRPASSGVSVGPTTFETATTRGPPVSAGERPHAARPQARGPEKRAAAVAPTHGRAPLWGSARWRPSFMMKRAQGRSGESSGGHLAGAPSFGARGGGGGGSAGLHERAPAVRGVVGKGARAGAGVGTGGRGGGGHQL